MARQQKKAKEDEGRCVTRTPLGTRILLVLRAKGPMTVCNIAKIITDKHIDAISQRLSALHREERVVAGDHECPTCGSTRQALWRLDA